MEYTNAPTPELGNVDWDAVVAELSAILRDMMYEELSASELGQNIADLTEVSRIKYYADEVPILEPETRLEEYVYELTAIMQVMLQERYDVPAEQAGRMAVNQLAQEVAVRTEGGAEGFSSLRTMGRSSNRQCWWEGSCVRACRVC